MRITILEDKITGDRTLMAHCDGTFHEVGVIPRTKWKAVLDMQSAIVELCEKRGDWGSKKIACQSMIDAGQSEDSSDASAQVFDQLKLLRAGNLLGDLLKQAGEGDRSAIMRFSATVAKENMIRTWGSHVIRLTSVIGEALGTGIFLRLPNGTNAILTCSHVWSLLVKHEQIQMLCASWLGGIVLNQKMIKVSVDHLNALDMDDPDFMEKAGVDALQFERDSAIIVGDLQGLFPIGARWFDLRRVADLLPENETYAVVGYPRTAKGEIGAQFLQYESSATNHHVFTRHPDDHGAGSLDGASGGIVVAASHGRYRPVALMVEEHGQVTQASVDSSERSANPSVFHALALFKLRIMIEKAGRLPFRDRQNRVVFEC